MSQTPRIAIVGLGGIFPGAPTLEAFWELIASARSTAKEAPPGRWLLPPDEAFDPIPGAPDKVTSKRACFIEDFTLDPEGLALDPALLARLDPMFHLALHSARQAFRSARTERVDRARTGVVLAAIALPTDASSALADEALGRLAGFPTAPVDPLNRHVCGLPAGLVARALGFGGGSFTLDAACASSLYALKLAADELQAGRADAMLAGGLSRPDSLYTQMGFAQLRALSPSGRCAPFDARGDGLVVGEGCGFVVLKRLDDALAHGDTIHATITGIGLSNDVGGNLMSPDSEGQLRAMREAYRRAGWAPHQVDLVECHGTGTPVGDAVEFASLRTLWEGAPGRCVIGSVKSNVGHLLTGAGAAGLIKVLLAFARGEYPPTANFATPNPALRLGESAFEVLSRPRAWARRAPDMPRRAAVSGFGFGGINAHVLLEEWPAAVATAAPRFPAEPIAIVGLGACYGPWSTLASFQHRVLGGGDKVEPADVAAGWNFRERIDGFPIPALAVRVDRFRIPPRELEEMLPQQILMLDVAARAWDDAGAERGDKLRTGVFVGVALDPNTTNFHLRWSMPACAQRWAPELGEIERAAWVRELREAVHPPLTANRTMGALGGLTASRIARAFQIGGPSFTVSALESSGLRAVEIAVRALQQHELDQAIAGAVDFAADVRALAGKCAGEGAAAVVLKRLVDAERDGDRIYAVIRGVGCAGDEEAARRACADAGIDPRTVLHVETDAATAVAIGHAGAAAGMAALVKTCLALHGEIRPGGAPQYWLRDRADGPRRAGVDSAGADGNRVHVLLEEYEAPGVFADRSPIGPAGESLFVLEADDEAGLRARATELRDRVRAASTSVHDLAQSWWRVHGCDPRRALGLAFVAGSRDELVRLIESALAGLPERGDGQRVFFARAPLGRRAEPARVAFVFPGSGNHFRGMGRELFAHHPQILQFQDAENERLKSQFAGGLFWDDAPGDAAIDHRSLIFSQVVLGTMVSDLVRTLGVRPEAVIGHSLGETAGLFALRAWRDRDEMLARMQDTTLFTEWLAGPCRAAREAWGLPPDAKVDWSLGVVDRPPDVVRAALTGRARVYLLIVNTPDECVVGGDARAVEELVRALGSSFHPLAGVTTVHCEVVRPVEQAYRELHLFPTRGPDGIAFYSGIAGCAVPLTSESAAESIVGQALGTLDYPHVIRRAYDDGVRVFLEMGPGASCTRMIGKILGDRPHLARSACAPGLDGPGAILRLAAHLIAERIPIDPSPLFDPAEAAAEETGPTLVIPVGLRPPKLPPPPAPKPRMREPVALQIDPVPLGRLAVEIAEAQAARAAAHETFLRASQAATEGIARALDTQMALLHALGGGTTAVADSPPVALDRAQCLEFAVGSIAKVLGPAYAPIDAHPTRVRLPDEPLMLVDRILAIEGAPRSLEAGRVITEHDILPGDWYLDGGRIPTCIAVESGQADLFLSGYLGIDERTRGLAVYRLLDAVVTFHDALPGPGKVIRYDIRIDRFFLQGETHLFRFRFEATVDGRPLLSMTEGCAGFFTHEQLAEGKGIVHTTLDVRPLPGKRPADWRVLAPMAGEAFSDAQVDALRRGDLEAAFGAAFRGKRLDGALRLPAGRMTLVHRVESLDPTGGRFGLGVIRGEADIRPDDWFLTCHFVDDRVMPGTLMYECCLHTLRIFLLRLGWVVEKEGCGCEPIPGVGGRLKCRGQVTETTRKVTYEVTIKELGYGPEPFAIADALMYADGKPIVEMTDMSLRISGVTRADVEAAWQAPARRTLFDRERILAFSVGKPSDAFGDRYRIFDSERVIARLPGPPYLFMDRVVRIEGCEPWQLAAGGVIDAEYDVPPDAWYFASNRQARMPFAVLLEIALQPCGWLAGYLGSALTSATDLSFRNLGGKATQFLSVTADAGTLTTTVKITRVSSSGGMVIQNYDLEVRSARGTVYRGDTYFGFFSQQALAQQVGVRDAVRYDERRAGRSFRVPDGAPFPDPRFRMIDRVDLFVPDGGPQGLGFIRGGVTVDPGAWFFQAHFFQDPVWPGSLGLESMLQLLKVLGRERWGGDEFETVALGRPHAWVYRGQVIPANREVSVEAVVTAVDEPGRTLTADGFLLVDGRVIYQMNDFTLRMNPV